jgi:hypothetical protein
MTLIEFKLLSDPQSINALNIDYVIPVVATKILLRHPGGACSKVRIIPVSVVESCHFDPYCDTYTKLVDCTALAISASSSVLSASALARNRFIAST